MKRRQFLSGCGLLLASSVAGVRTATAAPCPPPSLDVEGGASQASGLCPAGENETLRQVAEALAPGEFADLPQSAQNPLTLHNPEISWQTICWYDEARGEIQYMGAPQASFTTDHQHYIFDERTSTWRTTGQRLFPSIGHVWSSAFDPATGDFYFKRMVDDTHVKWMRRSVEAGRGAQNSPWTQTSGHPELAERPHQKSGMAWHPNLFGAGDGGLAILSNDRIIGWRKSTDTWHDVWVFGDNQSYSFTREGTGIYLPARDEVILGTGLGSRTLLYVSAGSGGNPGSAGPRGDTPIEVRGHSGSNSGAILLHPSVSSRILLLENNTGSRVWTSDDDGASWTRPNWSHPFGSMSGANGSNNVRCTVSSHGVVVGLTSRATSSASPTFRVWKPRT